MREAAVRTVSGVGIGWRQPHYQALMQQRPDLGFLQVHSENFFAPGGAARQVLLQARQHYEISLHGVGLSLGSAAGLDPWHLDRLACLVEQVQPLRVSDHASFARVPYTDSGSGTMLHAHDLLPIAFSESSLDIMVANVQLVQERLRRPLLVENLSAYLAWDDDQLAEPEFFNALARRSGCGLLLDVNNLVVNALNRGADDEAAVRAACVWIDALSPEVVGEIHLAGYARLDDIVIDDHGSRVHAPVWRVYRHALQRLGAVPSLIEWDTDVPELTVLLEEAALMHDCLRAAALP
jgi:uncharacterized protein